MSQVLGAYIAPTFSLPVGAEINSLLRLLHILLLTIRKKKRQKRTEVWKVIVFGRALHNRKTKRIRKVIVLDMFCMIGKRNK